MRALISLLLFLTAGCATSRDLAVRPYDHGDELTRLGLTVECLVDDATATKDCRVRAIEVNGIQEAWYLTKKGPRPSIVFRAWEHRWEPTP